MRRPCLSVLVGVLAIMISPCVVMSGEEEGLTQASAVSNEIKSVLADYNHYLSSGANAKAELYSSGMDGLVHERRMFYQEFFSKGLHCALTGIDTEFKMDEGVVLEQKGHLMLIDLVEIVTLRGEPLTTSPDEYPPVLAARWALKRADNENVKRALEIYIKDATDGMLESVDNGVEITLRVNHLIELESTGTGLRLVRDDFNDKALDNLEGFDNITWTEDGPHRIRPTWEAMPDYSMYRTPVAELGASLLADFTEAYAGDDFTKGTGFWYNRSGASSYINYYSSNTSLTCSGTDTRQDKSYYNSSYAFVHNHTGCNDCVNFVSQALRNGGFPTDGSWYPSISCAPWVWVSSLRDYLIGLGAVQWYTSGSSLQLGDLVFVGTSHVAMIGGVNPVRYSGHTNDRKLLDIGSSFSGYLHVKSYIP